MVACAEHGRLCAYRGDEADRCPWCHCLWAHVLASGYHSCEVARVWSKDKAGREVRAARMRREAAIRVGRRPNRVGVDLGPTPTMTGA